MERWNNEHRWDILRYASVFPDGDADLWIDRLWAANSNRGSVSDPPAALSGSHPKAPGLSGGYLQRPLLVPISHLLKPKLIGFYPG